VWGTVQFTWVAIVVTLGATAAIPLGLMIIFRFVPILALDEMMETDSRDEREPAFERSLGTRSPP